MKTAVNRELEVQRAEKTVGSGLSAEVDLFCDGQLADDLARLGEELRFVLIVSRASVNAGTHAPEQAVATEVAGLSLRVTASEHENASAAGIIVKMLVRKQRMRVCACAASVMLPETVNSDVLPDRISG